GVNGRPEKRNRAPFDIEVDPTVRGYGVVVLAQRAEETIEIFEPESRAMHLMQGGQGVTDRSPIVACSILRRPLDESFGQQEAAVIEGDWAGRDRRRRSDSCAFPHEGQAAQLGLELFASTAVESELREYR